MSTLLTRMLKDRCTRCQVGQGRGCSCLPTRKSAFRWPRLSDTALVWLLIVIDVGLLVLAFKFGVWIVHSWRAM